MSALRPDRVLKVLTAIASVAYFGALVLFVILLIAVPAAKLFGEPGANFTYSLALPVSVSDVDTNVATAWGPAPVKLDTVRGTLQLSIPMLPWSVVAALWVYTAAIFGLGLTCLQNLRRLFQRVRDGAPFDAQNALRVRTVGLLVLALAIIKGIGETATSVAVRRGLAADSPLAVRGGIHLDVPLVLFALVLVALAEVFRRGAELEHEQSLVV
jgi:hypothetical protein